MPVLAFIVGLFALICGICTIVWWQAGEVDAAIKAAICCPLNGVAAIALWDL